MEHTKYEFEIAAEWQYDEEDGVFALRFGKFDVRVRDYGEDADYTVLFQGKVIDHDGARDVNEAVLMAQEALETLLGN